MERLVIEIPDKKIALVKQLLVELGVSIQHENEISTPSEYQRNLLNVSVWTNEDLKVFDENKKSLESWKPQQW
jgi:predicted transport protein